MLYTIQNDFLSLTVDTLGGQMMNLKKREGTEYLWQGDSRYWSDRAPVLFPFIARLTKDRYTFQGKEYPMSIHGFASSSEFSPVTVEKDVLELELTDNEETRKQYPFSFSFKIRYALLESSVDILYSVENRSDLTMPYALGGHPGFGISPEKGEELSDFRLEFSQACCPDRVGFTPFVFLSGKDEPYPLKDHRILPLSHELFDEDAVILKNMAREVTLCSDKSKRSITVSYPDFPYLGIWHWPKTNAPYVCIEPWSSLPSRQDVVEEFTCKSDMLQLPSKKTADHHWRITVNG